MRDTTFDSEKNVFCFDLIKCFLLLNPLNVKSKHSGCEFKYFVLVTCKKISEN